MIEKGKDAHEVASYIAKTSGLLRELYDDKTVEGLARYENVQELLNSIKAFVDNEENDDKSLSTFLQTVSLMTNADAEDEDGDNDRVTMMTIHGAKGLEFKNVFVVGLEENLFPSQMMAQSRADLEEERRLFYVAVTRAEKRLTLSYAEQRYNYGRLNSCEPSRFLLEIDKTYLQMPSNKNSSIYDSFGSRSSAPSNASYGGFKNRAAEPAKKPAVQSFSPKPAAPSTHVASDDFKASNTADLQTGNRVEHGKFGFGTVTNIDFNGTDRKATIKFDTQGEKTLLLSFAKLRIVE